MRNKTIESKKVLFTSHVANFQKFNRPFMRWFSEQGWEVHYASMGEETIYDSDTHFTIPFERNPLKFNNVRAVKLLKKIIDEHNYDIIHTHTPMGSVITRIAARAARKKNTRVIYTAHGLHFFTGAPLVNWLTYYPVEKIMARLTDTLITINKEDYTRARKRLSTDVCYIDGVGVDTDNFTKKMSCSARLMLRQSIGIKKNDFVAIYPAELSKRKNQLWLISTFSDLIHKNNDIHLLLPGKDSLKGECQKLSADLEIDKNVHFLGYRDDISLLMQVSDLAVSSSRQEGLPVNILEAMCLQLPIVATDCRGNRDLIVGGKNGFLTAQNDITEFQAKISLLLDDKTLRATMGEEGALMADDYSLDKVMTSMQKIYNIKEKS